jgi:hypothetical protein
MMMSSTESEQVPVEADVDEVDGVDQGDGEWEGAGGWLPEVLSSPEASAITAFTLALASVFGPASIVTFVADALMSAPWDPSSFKWRTVIAAGLILLLALGAVILGRRVVATPGDDRGWSDHVARAAIVVGAVSATLSAFAFLNALLRSSPNPGLP